MERSRITKAREIFAGASERAAAERAAYLAAACGGDAEVYSHVASLLAAHERAGEFLADPTIGLPRPTPPAENGDADPSGDPGAGSRPDRAAPSEGPGAWIGRYKLLQLIGEGGFGSVFLAEQERPVRRKVALKVIKLGMDTKQVVARFEAERQALAMMDHPNIAKVLDAGATDSGRPYFVMELVRGVPVTEYCDTNNLTTRQRLELFVLVCRAVQHAHQKGVIHRDIKPNNVLVTLHDGVPVPKVIDFGIAKATGGERLTDRTLFTEHRQMVGTPQYMSPEQAEMSGLDVDTRGDVYSLGVILYELLTGTTPFDVNALRGAPYGEIQRILREVEPPPPSTRLGTLGDSLTAVAAQRRIEPGKLGRLVRGELDWVVMKCLEKDRTRRYDTASALAEDVRRYLCDEVVSARPPVLGYRLRKAVRKNKLPLAAAAAVVLSLVVGLGAATGALLRARAARDRAMRAIWAEARQRIAAESATEQAEHARAQAVAVNDLMHQVFTAVNRRRTGDEAALRRSLDEAAARIDGGSLRDQPELDAAVRTTVGNLYFSWGFYPQAERELRAALDLRRRLAPAGGNADLAKSLADLGWLLNRKGEFDEAEAVLREALQMRRRLLGPRDPAVADTLHALAMVLLGAGDREAARPLVRESLAIRLGECDAALAKSPGSAALLSLRGHVRARSGDLAGAAADYAAAAEVNPAEMFNWFQQASLHLYAGDAATYRQVCRQMVTRFGGTRSPAVAERTAKACLLDPGCAADPALLDTLGTLVDRAVGSNPPPVYAQWFHVTKGIYEYRRGNYGAAVDWLRRGRDALKPQAGRALADFFLAMSFHRTGRASMANAALAEGVRVTPDHPLDIAGLDPLDGGSAVGNWLVARIARREAERLIRGVEAPAPSGPPGLGADGPGSDGADEAGPEAIPPSPGAAEAGEDGSAADAPLK